MHYAKLDIAADGTPRSVDFNDLYFSRDNGLGETEHVFLDGNRLAQRFRQLPANAHFTIAETGFGTGLNFLATWHLFLATAPAGARLTFISCEKFPLSPIDLQRLHQRWPALNGLAVALQAQYPPLLAGYHLLEFGSVRCLLMLGDGISNYRELSASVDAWFLDGFAPRKNPDLWGPELFAEITRLSHPGTTLTTYSAARHVRDGLVGAGFQVRKVAGFASKRDMTQGQFVGICGPTTAERPCPGHGCSRASGQTIAIIGSGIAAATTAYELSQRGFATTLFEQGEQLAAGASGNRQGAVYANLAAKPDSRNRFYAQALLCSQQALAKLPAQVPHAACGLAQLADSVQAERRLQAINGEGYIPPELARWQSAVQLSQRLGVRVETPGLWYSGSGWADPQGWVEHLIRLGGADFRLNTEITSLAQEGDEWRLTATDGRSWRFHQVVLCTAFDTLKFDQTQHLPLGALAGQISQFSATPQQQALKAVVCSKRYVMPPLGDRLTIGSSFRINSTQTELREVDHDENWRALAATLPALATEHAQLRGGRAGVRCTASDYLPLVGQVYKPSRLREHYEKTKRRRWARQIRPANPWRGLWVNTAHGSKGLCSAHLCAKYLAACISGEPSPLQRSLAAALDPNRFIKRAVVGKKA